MKEVPEHFYRTPLVLQIKILNKFENEKKTGFKMSRVKTRNICTSILNTYYFRKCRFNGSVKKH